MAGSGVNFGGDGIEYHFLMGEAAPENHDGEAGGSTRQGTGSGGASLSPTAPVEHTPPPPPPAPAEHKSAPARRKLSLAEGADPATGLLTGEQKKINHVTSEQKRRAQIRAEFDELAKLIPGQENNARKEGVLLTATLDYVQELLEENTRKRQRCMAAGIDLTKVQYLHTSRLKDGTKVERMVNFEAGLASEYARLPALRAYLAESKRQEMDLMNGIDPATGEPDGSALFGGDDYEITGGGGGGGPGLDDDDDEVDAPPAGEEGAKKNKKRKAGRKATGSKAAGEPDEGDSGSPTKKTLADDGEDSENKRKRRKT